MTQKLGIHTTRLLNNSAQPSKTSLNSNEELTPTRSRLSQLSKAGWQKYANKLNIETNSLAGHSPRNSYNTFVKGLVTVEADDEIMKSYSDIGELLEDNQAASENFVIHPKSKFRFWWDIGTLFVVIINTLTIPYDLAFCSRYEHYTLLLEINWFSDLWFLFDIFLNFNTGYDTRTAMDSFEKSTICMDRAKIRKNYFACWFWLDALATIPFDLYCDLFHIVTVPNYNPFIDNNNKNSANFDLGILKIAKITRFLQLTRLVRLSKLIQYTRISEKMQVEFKYDNLIFYGSLFGYISLVMVLCHFLACLQFGIPCAMHEGPMATMDPSIWIVEQKLHLPGVGSGVRWSWSLCRAISQMLCIGYGNSPPGNVTDITLCLICMVIGAIAWTIFVGYFTALLHSYDATAGGYKEEQFEIKQFTTFRNFPKELVERIEMYYENRFAGKTFDEDDILKELNPILREQVIHHNCKHLVDSVPFLTNAPNDFISDIFGNMRPEVFLPGDCIIRQNDTGDCMYFIKKGVVVIRDNDMKLSLRLTDNNYFGELSLIYKDLKRTANIFAETYCYMYVLRKADLDQALRFCPEMEERIAHFAKERDREANTERLGELELREEDDWDETASESSKGSAHNMNFL